MIVGFFVFGVTILYLLITLFLIRIGVHTARQHGNPGWKGGVKVLIVMYLLMFWDFIPMQLAHRYYCASEGGFTVYQTLEQWKAENPGVAETLEPLTNAPWITEGNKTRVPLNQRFVWDTYTTREFMEIRKRDEQIVDTKTGDVLARYVDFDDGMSPRTPKRFRDFKFWLVTGGCESGQKMPGRIEFNGFKGIIEDIGENHGYQ